VRRSQRVAVVVAAVLAAAGATVAAAQTSSFTPQPLTDQVAFKANLLIAVSPQPRILILGGSRGMRFEPSYLRQKTGLPGFNTCSRNASPIEAWGLVNFSHRVYPQVRPRYLWLVHVKEFRATQLLSAPCLSLQPRFSRYFPASFVREQRPLAMKASHTYGGGGGKFRRDGSLYWTTIDATRTLAKGLQESIDAWMHRNALGTPTFSDRRIRYFVRCLSLMNQLGAKPVIVLMPVHPTVLKAIRDQGWQSDHDKVIAYLESLASTYRFELFDFSEISSFHGIARAFWDGYHPKVSNTRLIIDEILRRDRHAFDPIKPFTPTPAPSPTSTPTDSPSPVTSPSSPETTSPVSSPSGAPAT
jgi:hypothetical protein